MSSTTNKAEEILSRGQQSKSSQHWGHSNLDDEEALGAHWNTNSRRTKKMPHNNFDFDDRNSDNLGPSGQQETGDDEPRKLNDTSARSENRPRSKNRRPDVAVYVPRARRAQESSQFDSTEAGDVERSCSGDTDTKGKPRRNKAGMEVYVPRPKRLQQSGEMKREGRDKSADDRIHTSSNHEYDKQADSGSKESKKSKKHRTKEHVAGDCDRSSDPDNKDYKKKHKYKSKSGKEDKDIPKGEADKHRRQHKQQAENVNLHQGEGMETKGSQTVCEEPIHTEQDGVVVSNETWEDELKFYDTTDSDRLESNVNVEETDNDIGSEKCLEENVTAAEHQDSHDTHLQASGAHPHQGHPQQVCNHTLESSNKFAAAKDSEIDNAADIVGAEELAKPLDQKFTPLTVTDELSEKPSKRRKSSEGENDNDIGLEKESMQQTESTNNGASGAINCDSRLLNVGESNLNTELQDGGAKQLGKNKSDVTVIMQNVVLPENQMTNESEKQHYGEKESVTATSDFSSESDSKQPHIEDGGTVAMEEEEDGDTWDSLFNDDGEALDPKLMDELTAAVGKVKVQKTQFDYYNYQPKDPDLDGDEYGHLIEIYDFPTELITRDLLAAFREYKDRGFDIKWVDDNHAIGIFSSPIAAQAVLGMKHPLMKVRPISQASKQTKVKAKKCAVFMEPYRARPETTAAVARSLVTGALGLKSNLTREQRDEERKKLREAKEKRRQERQQKKDAWDGSYGKCAMDM